MRQQRIANSFANTETSTDLSKNEYKNKSILRNLFIDNKVARVNSLKVLCQNIINKNEENSFISKFNLSALNTLEEKSIDSITVKMEPKTAKRRHKRSKLFVKNVTKKKKRKLNDTASFNNETVELESVLDVNDFLKIELKTEEVELKLLDSYIEEKENKSLNNFMDLINNELPYPNKFDFSSTLSPSLKASPERNHDKKDQNNRNDNLELSQNKLPNDYNYVTNVKMECPNCGIICSDIKQLAIHQMSHLSVKLNCINRVLILDPRFRRGLDYTVQGVNRLKCLNCLKRFSNANMLKNHWILGKCDYYCKICSMDFSSDPNKLPTHVLSVHKIKYYRNLIRQSTLKNACPKIQNDPKYSIKIIKCESLHSNTDLEMTNPKKKTIRKKRKIIMGKFSCEKCFCSFPNVYSKNSHMRLHKTINTN